MQVRSLISAAAGTAAAISLATQVFAQAAGGKEKESYETPVQSRCTECEWTATRTQGVDAVRLTVKGVCQEPTPGFKLTLTRVDLPGSDPSTLTLVLTAAAPTGIEPQHVTPTPVEYQQAFVLPKDRVPAKVTIFDAAAAVQLNAP
jgi:hypothetical protein